MLSTPAHAACQVEAIELPVKMVGSRAVATVGINGTSVLLTVDSGAAFSMLTDAVAEQLKLPTRRISDSVRLVGVTGGIEARVTTVEQLQLLKGELPSVQFIVGGNSPGAGTVGLMGRNLLAFTDTEYDLANGMIRFMFPTGCGQVSMAYWAGTSPVSEIELEKDSRNKTPDIRGPIKLNGHELMAVFDTGATTIVSAKAAHRVGVAEADMTPDALIYGAGSGSSKSWTARFDKFEIGGETISHNTLSVGDFDFQGTDLLLGIDFFLSHRIYISKSQNKMFFTYNGGTVFALNRSEAAPATGPSKDADTQVAKADEFARRGAASAARRDYASALADLNRACELEPTSAVFLAARGSIEEALQDPVKALADFDRALQLEPMLDDTRAERASVRWAMGDHDGAKHDLDDLDRTLAPQANMRLTLASLYLHIDQPAQTIVQLDRWLSANRSDIDRGQALNDRCWARARLGIDLKKALDDCNEAIAGNEKNAAYLDSRGWVYLRLGDYPKALSDFDLSLAAKPNSATSLYGRGVTKTRAGDAARGNIDLAAARKAKPDIDAEIARSGLTKDPSQKP